jgi:hypothetical protein
MSPNPVLIVVKSGVSSSGAVSWANRGLDKRIISTVRELAFLNNIETHRAFNAMPQNE